MRSTALAVAIVAFGIGCGSRARPVEQPVPESADLIDDVTYTSRMSGLRATLARSSVAMDTTTIRTCHGDHGNDCVRCDIASRAESSGVDPELLDGVSIAFARYPTSVLRAAKLDHVALCRRIRFENQDPDHGPAGLADINAHRMLISIEHFVDNPGIYTYFTVEEIVHHELYHLFDHENLGEAMTSDHEWRALNPRGFAYRDPATGADRPTGFVNAYATTNEMEDRASVFEYLMGRPDELCEIASKDPVVAAKASLVFRRFETVTGQAFMASQATCFDRHGKYKPKPPPKPPSKSKRKPSSIDLKTRRS